MVVDESGLDLDSPQEGLLGEGAVIYAERYDRLFGRYITVGHERPAGAHGDELWGHSQGHLVLPDRIVRIYACPESSLKMRLPGSKG